MRAQMSLSKTRAECVSRWRGYADGTGISYTQPEWDYDNIVITVPEELTGAVFVSSTYVFTLCTKTSFTHLIETCLTRA